ncbi:MAG: hypothetical protein JJE21_05830 [Spirochaetaceae bacterium]|nr:hypothetical protein [Spirochaetaceae bacterium]
MSNGSISKVLLTPLLVGIISFFTIFAFFPSFGSKYLGVGYHSSMNDNSAKLEEMVQQVSDKTGTSVDAIVEAANSSAFQDILNQGVQKGQAAASKVVDSVSGIGK